ncbi:MAG: class I SAM-dependent methyltransferase family protein [Minisyncoccia bacterium]
MNNKLSDEVELSLVDNDENLKLEVNGPIRRVFNLFFIPLLNTLPKNFKHVIKKTNKAASVVIENATNHKALEVLYSKGELFSIKKVSDTVFKYVWFNMSNSKAVRNRLKFVKRELRDYLKTIVDTNKNIEIISIASGSSRAIIDTVKEGYYPKNATLTITFLDKDEKAINYSKELSKSIEHLPVRLNWINTTVGTFLKSSISNKYDIVEIVGLLDYFTDEKVVDTFSGIHSILVDGGVVITANINHNLEEKFVGRIIDWNMIYRSVKSLSGLVEQAGFKKEKMKYFYEPLMIHGIVVAKK